MPSVGKCNTCGKEDILSLVGCAKLDLCPRCGSKLFNADEPEMRKTFCQSVLRQAMKEGKFVRLGFQGEKEEVVLPFNFVEGVDDREFHFKPSIIEYCSASYDKLRTVSIV